MPISNIEPEKIQAVRTYLEQEFPDTTIETFPRKYEDWQGYTVNFEKVVELHRIYVTYEFFRDTTDIPARLHELSLAAELRKVGREQILVTTEGIREAYL